MRRSVEKAGNHVLITSGTDIAAGFSFSLTLPEAPTGYNITCLFFPNLFKITSALPCSTSHICRACWVGETWRGMQQFAHAAGMGLGESVIRGLLNNPSACYSN